MTKSHRCNVGCGGRWSSFCVTSVGMPPIRRRSPRPSRRALAVATLVRAYPDIAQDLDKAGYDDVSAMALNREVEFYGDTRNAIKKHSGEELGYQALRSRYAPPSQQLRAG